MGVGVTADFDAVAVVARAIDQAAIVPAGVADAIQVLVPLDRHAVLAGDAFQGSVS